MDLRIFTEPQQGATYDDLLAVASTAERLGFGAFFRSDHYLGMGTDGLPGPTDAWVTLAGLARDTTTIRLGTLVTSATFRRPGPARDHRGGRRPDERGPRRARVGCGLVRRRAPGLRDPVPGGAGALRPARGAAGDRHRAVVDAGRRTVLARGRALPARGLPRAAQAHPGADPGDRRRPRPEADAPARGDLRERVQHPLRAARGGARAVRPGPRRLRGGRPRPGVADLLLRAGDRGRERRRRGRPPARRHRAHPRAARPGRRPGRHPRRRSATSSPRGATPAPSASTCRSWTWPTWSTSS